MKILICEDEGSIRAFLKINFERNGFSVVEAESGEEALRLTELEKPHVVVLDIMLPGIDGYEVCRRLRESHPNIGIIMLTAKGQDTDKIVGLERGADDGPRAPAPPGRRRGSEGHHAAVCQRCRQAHHGPVAGRRWRGERHPGRVIGQRPSAKRRLGLFLPSQFF